LPVEATEATHLLIGEHPKPPGRPGASDSVQRQMDREF
jgi:hypothetical protein